jgi:CRP/FNR family cyclic AMP-dependent transcriptional regulator
VFAGSKQAQQPPPNHLPQRERVVGYLKSTDIFRDLSGEEAEEIHDFFPMSRCRRGTVFFHPGESGDRLYILKEGRVVLYRLTADGKRVIVGNVKPGTVFGELALAGLSLRECYAEAQEDSLVCEATRTDVERLIQTHPSVGFRLIDVLGRRVLELEERIEEMAHLSVSARVASVLLRLADPEAEGRFVRGYTHDDVADAAGAARQTVSTALRELEEAGIVRLGRMKVEILDRDRLARLTAARS